MSLPSAHSSRRLLHRRSIELEVFRRDDGLWEVDARLNDIKPHDWQLSTGLRKAGEPIHDMTLRLVLDSGFTVVDVGTVSEATPYPEQCPYHGNAYRKLIGVNALIGFRRVFKERLGGVLGCSHITELANSVPTALVQAYGSVVENVEQGFAPNVKPMQIDRCHALRGDGEAVRLYYPKWYSP